ncbi:hypothetical protein ACI3PL_31310, partial [Lacticaseibacillus paracasei]
KGQKIKRVAQEFIKDSINIKKQYKFKFKFNALVVHIYWEKDILSSKYTIFHFKQFMERRAPARLFEARQNSNKPKQV